MKRVLLALTLVLFIAPVAKAQDIKLNGTISAESNQIKNVADPTDAQDTATKSYVDGNVNAFSGSYNDLTDKPTIYTQSEVDAIISDLQNQINDLKPLKDVDWNNYEYIRYGDQVWTVENAEMVKYTDGTEIPQVTDPTQWFNLTTGAWCYYDNDPSKGKLYNWYAVAGIHDNDPNTPNKEFAPEGWHVPSDAEWTTLEEYLIANGYNYDSTTTGNKIAKAIASTTGWNSSTELGAIGNDQSLNNSSGFNAFPEGYRNNNGSFLNEGSSAIFWSSTENDPDNAWYRDLLDDSSDLDRVINNKRDGFSVRFVRD
ncbi:fibrobacter succinogenes major paralogous domain-containing protein [Flavobacteriaceae bacterium]|nr:fibrobacter succinogenes major paralogous domain-containing protein [Flavobacteriaceae bacterium]MDC0571356.1 fibrobacter succinogenes major paralogous domain-containing protein [Flavobacteriaceae bacterium]